MEKDSLMKVIEPEFIDLEKTRIKFKIQTDSGGIQVAEIVVPKDGERGINQYWDQILDNYDIQELRKKRNEKEILERRQREMKDKQRKANEENERLRRLFNKKMKAFDMPFIKDASSEIRSAIRRAPDMEILDLFLYDITINFMKQNNMSYVDYLDYLDDLEDEKQAKKDKVK